MSDTGSILVIRLSSLGDVLLCAPTLRALRARFPESNIDFLVASEFVEAARLLPCVNAIITFDRKDGWRGLLRLRRLLSKRYELIVDLQNSLRSAFLRYASFPLMWTKANRYRIRRWVLINFKKNLYETVIPVPLRYLAAAKSVGVIDDGNGLMLKSSDYTPVAPFSKYVLLCIGAKHATKRWPIEYWIKLAELLRSNGYEVVVCGSGEEANDCLQIGHANEQKIDAPLEELARLMKHSNAVVCHDSGLMHLATGVGANVLAIFGPTVEAFGFFPFRGNARVVQQNLACRPCTAYGGDKCPLMHHDCMRLTTPEIVFDEMTLLVEKFGIIE